MHATWVSAIGLACKFESLIERFVLVLFWGSPEHPLVHRRHPLLSVELGTSIDEFRVDVLHTPLGHVP